MNIQPTFTTSVWPARNVCVSLKLTVARSLSMPFTLEFYLFDLTRPIAHTIPVHVTSFNPIFFVPTTIKLQIVTVKYLT